MFGVDQMKKILLLMFLSVEIVHNSEDKNSKNKPDQHSSPSNIVYKNPLRIYQYPPPNTIQTYIYFPEDGHYEVINHPVPFIKLDQHKLSPLIVKNSNLVKSKHAGFQSLPDVRKKYIDQPAPFKKNYLHKASPLVVKNEAVKSDQAISTFSEGGKKYEDSYHKNHGYKTNEGYDKGLKFDKGQKESYEKHHNSGDERDEKGSKSSDYDDHEHTEKDNKEEEKEHAEKYNSKKHHEKGSKSKGYHNIFMKDEYKKDHIFYDNSDEKGQYSKKGSDHTKYHNSDHKILKGSHKDSGNESHLKKKESLKEKKEYDEADAHYNKESKHKSKHDDDDKNYYFENGKSSYNVAIKHIV